MCSPLSPLLANLHGRGRRGRLTTRASGGRDSGMRKQPGSKPAGANAGDAGDGIPTLAINTGTLVSSAARTKCPHQGPSGGVAPTIPISPHPLRIMMGAWEGGLLLVSLPLPSICELAREKVARAGTNTERLVALH